MMSCVESNSIRRGRDVSIEDKTRRYHLRFEVDGGVGLRVTSLNGSKWRALSYAFVLYPVLQLPDL
jgi:hypothetical protein